MGTHMNLELAKQALRFILEKPIDNKRDRFVINDRLSHEERKAILWLISVAEDKLAK